MRSPNPVPEPVSLFELERRRRGLDPAAAEPSEDIPKLPSTSPWADDPVGKELPVDRREDGDTFGFNITEVDQ